MASWWDGGSLRDQLTSGVESLKKATQDIANELAEVDQTEEYTEEFDQELTYGNNNGDATQRLSQMYDELQKAYNLQTQELNELRSANEINQKSSHKLSDDLSKTKELNNKLRAEHQNAMKKNDELQSRITQLTKDPNNISSLSVSEESEIMHQLSNDKQTLEEELHKVKEEFHEFKKKTKAKWDGVKSKFQIQRQNTKQLEQENKDLKLKLEQMSSQTDDCYDLVDESKAKIKELTECKLQNEHAINEISIKFKEIEQKLNESTSKCIEFEHEIENDKQRMISLSDQHEQYKTLVKEQESEIISLREEIDRNNAQKLNELSMDEQTMKIIQDLKDDNQRFMEKNVQLKNTLSVSQHEISFMKSQVEEFKLKISMNLKRDIRPNVVLLEEECKQLKEKYANIESEFRQAREKNDIVKSQFEAKIFDLNETIIKLQNECDQNEKLHKEKHEKYETMKRGSDGLENELIAMREQNERLKESQNVLKEEITNLETQMKDLTAMYKDIISNKDEENLNLRRNLHTILYKNGVLNSYNKEDGNEGQENTELMTEKYLLRSLDDWIESMQQNDETKSQNIEIVMKQCDISRVLAIKLLNEHNEDASAAIFEYNQTTKSVQKTNNDLDVYKDKMAKFEEREQKYLQQIEENQLIIQQLKESNNKIAIELNQRQSKAKDIEAEYIALCNELDDISNAKHELETECDRLHDEVEKHQSVLEETRISSQEIIEQEQERSDKLMEELKELSETNKTLLAHQSVLEKQLHSKLKSDVADDNNNQTNIASLRDEVVALSEENDSLRMNLDTMKDINKKRMNEKDEDIMELNSVINHLKLECEELKALQSDFINVSAKYEQQSGEFEQKKKAFGNLQIAFDALQAEMMRLKEENMANAASNNVTLRVGGNANVSDENMEEMRRKLDEMRQKYESVTKQYQDVRSKFTQSQKYQIRLEHETANLRSTISKTAAKLQHMSNSEDQVDRRIIIKLLVTFFDRWYNGGDTKEVISLISKILKFDDKQCRICKVGKYGNKQFHSGNSLGIWGYATSWISSSGAEADNVEDGNEKSREDSKDLGSLWVEFLLNELGDDASAEIDAAVANEAEEEKTNAKTIIKEDNDNNDNNKSDIPSNVL